VETRQIAIIPLQPAKKGGELVVTGAWVVEEKKQINLQNAEQNSKPVEYKIKTKRSPSIEQLMA
jgi:hypothetical protein